MSPVVEVVRTYLELRSPGDLRSAGGGDSGARFIRDDCITVQRYRALYRDVGSSWHWHDRDAWTDEELAAYLAKPNVHVWECLIGDETAGYFELSQADDGAVEIVYFGLVGAFIGRGLGGAMLTRAVQEAWALGALRVWLHTCTLDSPRALPNYLARGFTPARKETYTATLPDSP
ncbi:MAG: GNAT family N-acetyltransferase [Gemmatimonadaceae bacterium]